MFARWNLLALVATLSVSLVFPAFAADSQKDSKKIFSAIKPNDSLEHIDVFAGIEQGVLEVKLIPQDAMGGNILIENKGEKPLNVDFPAAFIGKQVLKQAPGLQPGNGFGVLGNGGPGGQPGGGGAQIQGGGVGQAQGPNGGLGNPGGAGNGPGAGNGFFSVPTDKIIRVAYRSVCLEHGKPDPSPRMTYRLGKVEEFSDDPVLAEILKIVAGGEEVPQAAQAAAWHVANKMSWKQLGEKNISHVGRPATRYFTAETLTRAKAIHATAVARANEREAASLKTASDAAAGTAETVVKRN